MSVLAAVGIKPSVRQQGVLEGRQIRTYQWVGPQLVDEFPEREALRCTHKHLMDEEESAQACGVQLLLVADAAAPLERGRR